MHVIAGKAVAFGEALQPDYRAYTKQVIENAMTMSDVFVERGMKVISGGTDTHLLLLDVDSIGMSGKQAEKTLERVGITVNKNTIPGDPRPPTQASGIALGAQQSPRAVSASTILAGWLTSSQMCCSNLTTRP